MPQLRVVWFDQANTDLRRLDRGISNRIADSVGRYSLTNSGDVTKLSGAYAGAFRLRVGNYRVLFTISDGLMRVFAVRHRSEAYR